MEHINRKQFTAAEAKFLADLYDWLAGFYTVECRGLAKIYTQLVRDIEDHQRWTNRD